MDSSHIVADSYERKILIPADRTLRDLGRAIWAEIERHTLALIVATIPYSLCLCINRRPKYCLFRCAHEATDLPPSFSTKCN